MGLFHPVLALPPGYLVLDMTKGPDPRNRPGAWAVGKYDERREGIYNTPLFGGVRNIHVGIDLFGPVGSPLHAFMDGELHLMAYNAAAGDYGYTLITKHVLDNCPFYALWGHLSERSHAGKTPGQKFARGEVIAWIGDIHENGGWKNPHLHFQLSWEPPDTCDMPGVVGAEDREAALRKYPDPRLVLGPLY